MTVPDNLLDGIRSATIAEVAVLVREVRVRVGVLTRFVIIRIYHDATKADPYFFELSAVVRTPDGEVADRTRSASTENEALRRAVRILTQDYEAAVRAGEMPDDAWLIERR
jgi:hypothetical protein